MPTEIDPQLNTSEKPLSTKEEQCAPTIAIRKTCDPDGIGLSHYVLMDKKSAK